MAEATKEEKQFNEAVDRLLSGEEARTEENAVEDFRTAVEFAGKIIKLRARPQPAFQDALRGRLLGKLVQQEMEAAARKERTSSFWRRVRGLVPQSPAWRVATVTIAVVVLAFVVTWRMGLFAREPGPIVSVPPPMGSANLIEAKLAGMKDNYLPGEPVVIELTYQNVSGESLSFEWFPPAVAIEAADGGVVRTFAAGADAVPVVPEQVIRYGVTWDQLNDSGQTVAPGNYVVKTSPIELGEGKGTVAMGDYYLIIGPRP
jgi:hypothetical protein